jgi:hypothetical protein
MKKPKKITIKPFLNDNLEKVEVSFDEENDSQKEYGYPLYYMVIYNRNNTKIKSRIGFYYIKDEELPEDIIQHESKIIEEILRYLISINGEDIDLKGLGSYFDMYSQSLWIIIEKYLKQKLKFAAMGTDSRLSFIINFEDWRNNFSKYHEISLKLFEGISKKIDGKFKKEIEGYNIYIKIKDKVNNSVQKNYTPTIINWIYGNYKSIVIKELVNDKNKQNVIDLIDGAIEKYTKD